MFGRTIAPILACPFVMQWTAPTTGIAMCQSAFAVAKWHESAYGYARLSARGFRDGEYGTVSCARVFLSAALVTARHSVSGEVVTLRVPPRLMQIDAAKQADA